MSRFHNLDAQIKGAIEAGVEAENPPKRPPETPAEPEDEPETDPEEQPEKDIPMPENNAVEETAEYQAGHAAGLKAANDRMNAVFAHEDAKGREAHAARLLGRSMTAEEIIAELPNFAVASAPLSEEQQREAAEEGGRKEMLKAMEDAGNVDLGADESSEKKTGKAAADQVWNKAYGLDKEVK